LFILTNSEELVKDVFELFSKFNHPGLHGADHGRMKLLLCQGLAPKAYSVYYCVKRLSRIFFQILDAGRRSPVANPCHIFRSSIFPIIRCGPPKAPFIGELAAKGGLRG
ncbi:hypothetical protein, partial [uncultured Megasphaera sp.]|uniref:hypothetical protein n=1 Tax=uncultured Megasphaera sp. TaxID=165188 RepID=UPI00266FB62B